jgi:hypothetical protein
LGTLQSRGVIIGMIVICVGLIMMVRFKIPEDKSLTATTE